MPGTSKEYELLFLLKAQVDSSMRQFSVVGGQIKELEEKIQGYNATLKDVDAYRRHIELVQEMAQKLRELENGTKEVNNRFNEATAAHKSAEAEVKQHQAAIDALNIKIAEQGYRTKEQRIALERETQALKESKAALKEAKDAENEANRAKNQHQTAIDNTRQKLAKEREEVDRYRQSLKEAGVQTRNLTEEEKRLAAEQEELKRQQEHWVEFRDNINGLADQFAVMRMAAQGAMTVIRPILGFYGESLEAAARLEYSMSAVKAISGATADEEKRMTAVVKEMGATTVFTATEAAGAMEKMALAGWETEQMIAGLPAVVKLAAAAGEDLAEMTGIVTDGMNAFHLQGEQAAVKFADVLAKTATSSNTTVALLGQSLSYAETTAGNLGYTIEDVSLALAAMANNALKGGAAGTALNTMLTRMSGANETAAKEMDRLGLSMYEAATGQAKPLLEFLNELRGAFDGFGDDAQRAQLAAYNLAGMRGMRGLMAIVNQTDEQWKKLTEDVYAYAGAADNISNTRLDNYTGQVQLLKDAWDALQTTVGEQFLPTATDAVVVLRNMTNGVNDFAKENPGFVGGLGAAAVAASGTAAAITGVASAVGLVRTAFNTLGVGQLLGLVGGGVGVAALAITAGAAATAITAAENTEGGKYARTIRDQETAYRRQAEAAQESIDKMKELGDLEGERDARRNRLEYEQKYLADAQEALAEAEKKYRDYMDLLMDANGWTTEEEFWSGYDTGLNFTERANFSNYLGAYEEAKGAVEQHKRTIEEDKAALRDWAQANYAAAEAGDSFLDAIEKLYDPVYALGDAFAEAYRNYKELYDGVFGTFEEVGDITETTTGKMLEALQGQIDYWGRYSDNLEKIRSFADDNGIDLTAIWGDLSSGSQTAMGYTNAIVKDLESLPELVAKLTENQEVRDKLAEWQALNDQAVTDELENLKDEIAGIVEDTKAPDEAYSAMQATLQGYIDAIEDETVTAALERAAKKWRAAAAGSYEGSFYEAYNSAVQTSGKPASAFPRVTDLLKFGYAEGTNNARRGWHLVGEEGPELAWFNGGERVLPAEDTARVLAYDDTGGQSTEVHIHIPAGATAETIREARAYGEDVEKIVKRVLRDERVDTRRRSYT